MPRHGTRTPYRSQDAWIASMNTDYEVIYYYQSALFDGRQAARHLPHNLTSVDYLGKRITPFTKVQDGRQAATVVVCC